MALIDFTEIPKANIADGKQDMFELFAREFFNALGFYGISTGVLSVFGFCAFLESAFGFCVACQIYPFVYKLAYASKN